MVLAVKRVKSELPPTFAMTFHNNRDNQELNFSGEETHDIDTWVPNLESGQQIWIHVRDKNNNYHVVTEYYLWDEDFQLQCSTPDGLKTLLTVSGSRDIGINVGISTIQAYLV